eukprot:330253-Pyramimonas_sp.AAC.1
MSGLMGQRGPGQYCCADHGFVPRHRREESLLVQHIAGFHLQRSGMSHITNCHDLANAFFVQQQGLYEHGYASDVSSRL